MDDETAGFFDLDRRHKKLVKTRGFLENLNRFLAWETFRVPLDRALKWSSGGKGGRPAHNAVLMFNVLVLLALYNLSDEQTEYQILDRLSFIKFLGLELFRQRCPCPMEDRAGGHRLLVTATAALVNPCTPLQMPGFPAATGCADIAAGPAKPRQMPNAPALQCT
jgi:hypothetical protein